MAADRIHLAEPAPPHCSGCFQQKPQTPHVDFGAAYDGPAVPALEGSVGVVAHVIEDLILCQDCIETAAGYVGLSRAETLQAALDQAEAANRELAMKLAGMGDYAAKLEAALSVKPEPTRAKPGPKPRQGAKR